MTCFLLLNFFISRAAEEIERNIYFFSIASMPRKETNAMKVSSNSNSSSSKSNNISSSSSNSNSISFSNSNSSISFSNNNNLMSCAASAYPTASFT